MGLMALHPDVVWIEWVAVIAVLLSESILMHSLHNSLERNITWTLIRKLFHLQGCIRQAHRRRHVDYLVCTLR